MANQLTALKNDHTRRKLIRRFQVVVTGSYVNGTGEVLDFTNILNPNWEGNVGPSFNPFPSVNDFTLDRLPNGYSGEILQNGGNTGLNNAFALRIYSTGGTELASGAYPAAVLADTFVVTLLTSAYGG